VSKMTILTNRNTLLNHLAAVLPATEKKSAIPILAHLHLAAGAGRVTLTATDLDVTLRAAFDAETEGNGAFCLPAKKLADITRALPDAAVEIKADKQDTATLTCVRSKFKLLGAAAETFPTIPEPPAATVAIPAATLAAFVERVSFAVTGDESRYALHGAKLEMQRDCLRLVATDGHRLAYCEARGSFGTEFSGVIPKKALAPLAALAEGAKETVEFAAAEGGTLLHFRAGGRALVAKTLLGQFPAYEAVLPKNNPHAATVERTSLLAAVRRASLMADQKSHAVKVELAPGSLSVSSVTSDLGEAHDTLPVEYAGPQIAAGFNATYLIDFLSLDVGERVRLELKDAHAQAELKPAEGETVYRVIVMPMKL
jgi:DNA polymerase III subunit beta